MGLEYRSALVFGWEAEELRRKIVEAINKRQYDYVNKICEQLNRSDFIFDINEDFLYVGKIISDCNIYENTDTIFIDEINFKEFAREAYEQIESIKELWEPTEPPQLIHFCYVR